MLVSDDKMACLLFQETLTYSKETQKMKNLAKNCKKRFLKAEISTDFRRFHRMQHMELSCPRHAPLNRLEHFRSTYKTSGTLYQRVIFIVIHVAKKHIR